MGKDIEGQSDASQEKSVFWKTLNTVSFLRMFGVLPISKDAQQAVLDKIDPEVKIASKVKGPTLDASLATLVQAYELAEGYGFETSKTRPQS